MKSEEREQNTNKMHFCSIIYYFAIDMVLVNCYNSIYDKQFEYIVY
jgi:hypothetical protein